LQVLDSTGVTAIQHAQAKGGVVEGGLDAGSGVVTELVLETQEAAESPHVVDEHIDVEALDGTLRGELAVNLAGESFVFARVHAGDHEGTTVE
jgi:hypothetical protein